MSERHVVIYGEDHPGSLYHSYRRGFEELGWRVSGYCPASALARALPATRYRVARRVLQSVAASRLNVDVRKQLSGERADLILVLKGSHLSAESISLLREETGAPVVNYYPDDPFSKVRSNRLTYGPATLASYDACFTFARHLVEAYRAVGVRVVEYLPFARDPALHAPARDVPDPDFDIVFVGNLDDERVAWLEAVADRRIVFFGEHTRQALNARSPLRQAAFMPGVYGPEFARAIRRGAIALNVMRVQNSQSHNMRSYESPACAAFTMSQRTPEIIELFREGEEIICFGSRDELQEQVSQWLARPVAEREAIAQAGFRRVEHDTYTRRAETIVTAVARLTSRQRARG